MNAANASEALKLYRSLLRYSKQLKFTDVKYFKQRIRKEFEKNRSLESGEDIKTSIEVSSLILFRIFECCNNYLFISSERIRIAGT